MRKYYSRFSSSYYSQPWRGYGQNVVDVFATLRGGNFRDPFGPAALQFNGSGSYGNGGAMRIAPTALFGFFMNDHHLTVFYSKKLCVRNCIVLEFI